MLFFTATVKSFFTLLLLPFVSSITYDVTILRKGATPAISLKNAPGNGFSPCTFNFNPAWIPAANGNKSALILRVSGCPDSFGGAMDHLLMAYCTVDPVTGGSCEDVLPLPFANFEPSSEDPRIFEYNGDTYLYYFASGQGQSTVYLRKTSTPLDPSSWTHVAGPLPWHRNGCVILREDGTHFVLFGESPPLPGLGLATTTDFISYNIINATYMQPYGANNTNASEIVIEAGSTPVQLSTGDYLHLYAAGTQGWVANGNYTGGFIIMDGTDPSILKQRSTHHLFVPTMDYEIGMGTSIYPVNRNRTIFTTQLVPLGNDVFHVWYGAADAVVAWAQIQVTHS